MKPADAISQFIEKIAVAKEAEGFPRIAGRIIGLFLLYRGPFSFSEIAERLQVSRASVSTNLRLVRDRGIVELVSQPGDRQDYYQMAADPYRSSLEKSLQLLVSLERLARETATAVEGKVPDVHRRMTEMARVHAIAHKHVLELMKALYGAAS